MANINIPATKSITVSTKFPNKSLTEKIIIVGSKRKYLYNSFVFFDTSFVASDSILSATLVLFKISDFFKVSDFFLNPNQKFSIMPLLKPFSSLTTYNNSYLIGVDKNSTVDFCPFGKEVAIQINITAIVNKWLDHSLPNYGLLIAGHRSEPHDLGCTSFGSAYSKDNTLIPFISISSKQNIFCLLPPPPNVTYTTTLIKGQTE